MPTEAEIAWFAGLLEGEGCFEARIRPCRRVSLAVSLKMTDKDVVERAGTVVPTQTKLIRQEGKFHNWNPTWKKVWSGADAERVMRLVLPHMGARRRAKIEQCLATPNLSHYPRKELTNT